MLIDKGYDGKQGISCLSSCLMNYLNYKGYEIDETDIFISDAFRLSHNKGFNYDLKANVYEAIINFYEAYRVQCVSYNLQDNIKLKLTELIEKECMITLEVGCVSLNYNSIFKRSKPTEHFFNVTGIKEDMVYINDSYIPVYPAQIYNGWYDYMLLEKAWKETSYSYRIWNIPEHVTMLDNSQNNQGERLKKLQIFLIDYLSGRQDQDNYYGIDALKQIEKDLDIIKTRKKEEIPQALIDYNYMLKTKGLFTFKLAIQEAVEKINNQYINDDILETVRNTVREWNQLSMLIIRVSMNYKGDNDIIRLKNKVNAVIECEKEIYDKIIGIRV